LPIFIAQRDLTATRMPPLYYRQLIYSPFCFDFHGVLLDGEHGGGAPLSPPFGRCSRDPCPRSRYSPLALDFLLLNISHIYNIIHISSWWDARLSTVCAVPFRSHRCSRDSFRNRPRCRFASLSITYTYTILIFDMISLIGSVAQAAWTAQSTLFSVIPLVIESPRLLSFPFPFSFPFLSFSFSLSLRFL